MTRLKLKSLGALFKASGVVCQNNLEVHRQHSYAGSVLFGPGAMAK